MNKRKSGFTLIEMLIVIAVIGILASIILVGLGPVQRRGRDARRISDLRSAQNALELYFQKCGYYPGTAQSGTNCGAYSSVSSWSAMSTALTGSNIGTRTIPNDPSSGASYFYGATSGGTSYVIGARLEDDTNPALRDDIDGTINGVNCDGSIYCIEF